MRSLWILIVSCHTLKQKKIAYLGNADGGFFVGAKEGEEVEVSFVGPEEGAEVEGSFVGPEEGEEVEGALEGNVVCTGDLVGKPEGLFVGFVVGFAVEIRVVGAEVVSPHSAGTGTRHTHSWLRFPIPVHDPSLYRRRTLVDNVRSGT